MYVMALVSKSHQNTRRDCGLQREAVRFEVYMQTGWRIS
jgi:hypothetical protein